MLNNRKLYIATSKISNLTLNTKNNIIYLFINLIILNEEVDSYIARTPLFSTSVWWEFAVIMKRF